MKIYHHFRIKGAFMIFTIKTNGKFNNLKTFKDANSDIYRIEIDFTPPEIFSDLEFWLEDREILLDYAKMNLSKRNKMKFTKS